MIAPLGNWRYDPIWEVCPQPGSGAHTWEVNAHSREVMPTHWKWLSTPGKWCPHKGSDCPHLGSECPHLGMSFLVQSYFIGFLPYSDFHVSDYFCSHLCMWKQDRAISTQQSRTTKCLFFPLLCRKGVARKCLKILAKNRNITSK